MQIEPDKLFFNEKITSMDKSSMQGPNKGKKKLAYLKKKLVIQNMFLVISISNLKNNHNQ